MGSSLSQLLLIWYSTHARVLPWRENPIPYWVWVSEIMLQQTRVGTVLPYFKRWISRFPSIHALAFASQQEVLSEWEGLGYYSRARNLHLATQIVMSQYNGALPDQPALLINLPGIGSYTAAAIASIAYGLDIPAVDGNVRRVLSRVFDIATPVRTSEGDRIFMKLAEDNLPRGSAGDYNQALMDLGASVCTPRAPHCPNCPLTNFCLSYKKGNQEHRPVILPKNTVPHYTAASAVIEKSSQVLIKQRPENGLLGGMWEFPGGKIHPEESPTSSVQRQIYQELGVGIDIGEKLGVFKHTYTHFRETRFAFLCKLSNGKIPQLGSNKSMNWVATDLLGNYPMGKIDRQIANNLISRRN